MENTIVQPRISPNNLEYISSSFWSDPVLLHTSDDEINWEDVEIDLYPEDCEGVLYEY